MDTTTQFQVARSVLLKPYETFQVARSALFFNSKKNKKNQYG